MRTELLYDPSMPSEVTDALRPLLERWIFLAPHWLYQLRVGFRDDADEHGTTLECSGSPPYRHGAITVWPRWLTLNDADRETAIVHELLHFPWRAYQDRADDLIDQLYTDEAGRKQARQIMRDNLEAAVQDLAWSLTRSYRERALAFIERADTEGIGSPGYERPTPSATSLEPLIPAPEEF